MKWWKPIGRWVTGKIKGSSVGDQVIYEVEKGKVLFVKLAILSGSRSSLDYYLDINIYVKNYATGEITKHIGRIYSEPNIGPEHAYLATTVDDVPVVYPEKVISVVVAANKPMTIITGLEV